MKDAFDKCAIPVLSNVSVIESYAIVPDPFRARKNALQHCFDHLAGNKPAPLQQLLRRSQDL
jgi:hypothetical protein